MTKVSVEIPLIKQKNYSINISSNLLNNDKLWLKLLDGYQKIVIVTDTNVKYLYASEFTKQLKTKGYQVILIIINSGEINKNLESFIYIQNQMLNNGCNRNSLCLALGGGVIGDIAGFVAATFMRGIDYVQIPTTLLAMVDSSVGGKTAIDTSYGKNLIGCFWQPKAVVMDLKCLTTLSKVQLICGLIEALKIFLILDKTSFNYISENLDKIMLADIRIIKSIILKSVRLKAQVVKLDEKETGIRAILNFGHTIGHALEQLSNYTLSHGYAVALGMLVECKISELSGLLPTYEFNLIKDILIKLGINNNMLEGFKIAKLLRQIKLDKKVTKDNIYCVLLKNIGTVQFKDKQFTHIISDEIISLALIKLKEVK